MHVIKGGWVGQTFALAKLNESGGGRKTRIRRSKEERKTMVESFIKKYQKLNNGSFPSLSLTHKEVGGSFYTVREIVREIIQENRVLGPAKLTDNKTDIFSEQYPLGSISVEPQIHVESSNETHTLIHVVPNQYQGRSEELALNSSGQYYELQHQTIGDGKIVNESTVEIYRKEESEIPMNVESEMCLEGEKYEEKKEAEDVILEAHNQMLENENFVNGHTVEIERKEESYQPRNIESEICLEGERDLERELEESTAKVTESKTEIVVETFPLRPVSKTTFGLDEKLDEKETKEIEVDVDTVLIDSEEISSSLADEKIDSLSESSNGSTAKESIEVDVFHGTDLEVEDDLPTGNQPMNTPNGIRIENINNTNTHDSREPSILEETVEINNKKPDIQHGDRPTKIRDPTLDRINIESWEALSKKSARREINPIFKIIKEFVAAFVKFWSE